MGEAFPQPNNQERTEGKEKTTEELRQELLATGKVQEFIDMPSEALPDAIETEDIDILTIDSYLQKPVVVFAEGAFANNDERKAWRFSLPIEQQMVVNEDALRLNPMNSALARAQMVAMKFPDVDQGKKLLQELEAIGEQVRALWGETANNGYKHEDVAKQVTMVQGTIKPTLMRARALALETKK